MKTLQALTATILAWFGSFLVLFLCITVLTAVVTGMAGESHTQVMAELYKGFAGISGLVATVFAFIYAKEIHLISFDNYHEEDEEAEYHDSKMPFHKIKQDE